jgi:4-amino-4-deoxy-L-arabinose transferase-like glycosyltransferase
VLASILGFSLFTKLGLALLVWYRNRSAVWHPDSASYHSLAVNILNHGVFSRTSGPPFVYESFRTPGYPLLLAAVYRLFGVSELPFMVLQAITATGSVALIWLLGSRLFSPRVGALAAVILSLDVASVCLGQMLLSETVFTMLMVTAIWLLVRALPLLRVWPGFALSGLALACATFVRPVAYYLVPSGAVGIASYFVLRGRATIASRSRWRLAMGRAGASVLVPVLLVGGWQLRNLHETGSARFSQIEGQNMLWYRAAGAISVRDHKTLFQVQREWGLDTEHSDFSGWLAANPEFAGSTDAARGEEWLRRGMATVVRNPGWYLIAHLRGTAALLLEPGTYFLACLAGVETSERGRELIDRIDGMSLWSVTASLSAIWSGHRFLFLSSLWALIFLALLYTGVVLWLVRAPCRGRTAGVLTVVIVLGYFAITSAGPEASSRFRVPMMPLLAVLSAAGWQTLRRNRALDESGRSPQEPTRHE